MIDSHITQFQEYIITYNYFLLFGLLVAETSPLGVIIPGTLIIVLSAYYAGLGELSLFLIIVIGTLGVILGDVLSFCIGKYGWLKSDFIKRQTGKLSVVTDKITHNQNLIMVSHFPGYTRMFVPLLLGSSQFKFRAWIWRDSIGALLFVSLYSLVGYGIGSLTKNLSTAVTISKVLPIAFIGIFIIWVIFGVIKLRQVKKGS